MSDDASFLVGLPEEWEHFKQTHATFLKELQSVFSLISKVFLRTASSTEPADRVVFFLGRLAVEDFMEILLLCGNGYGIGGLKLLRGLFERGVTAAYVAQNPDEAERFLDYHHVHQGKLLNHAIELFGRDFLPRERVEQVQKLYEQYRNQFQEPLCSTCGTTRTMISWSKLDVASMAKKANRGFEKLYLPCYFNPTLQAHSTMSALIARLIETEDGGVAFDGGAQRDKAREALIGAHNVMLFVLDTQNSHFHLGFERELEALRQGFLEVWAQSQTEASSSESN